MSRPIELVQDASRDEWSDPVEVARKAADGLLAMTAGDWIGQGIAAVTMLKGRRPDSSLLLAVTDAALDPDAHRAATALRRVIGQLDDRTWAAELGLRIAHHESLGVVSLGSATLAVLEAAATLGGSSAELLTDLRAVARGLGYLRLPVVVAPPEEAEAVLIPAVAVHGERIWTTARASDVALRALARESTVVPIAHPLASLSPLGRRSYRPAATIIDLRL